NHRDPVAGRIDEIDQRLAPPGLREPVRVPDLRAVARPPEHLTGERLLIALQKDVEILRPTDEAGVMEHRVGTAYEHVEPGLLKQHERPDMRFSFAWTDDLFHGAVLPSP